MIKLALFDIDGVLTDGRIMVDSKGEEFKTICFDDIDAIFELKRNGVKIGFITGENNSFTEYVSKRFTPDIILTGCKNKLDAFLQLIKGGNLDRSEVSYTGDSKKDIGLLEFLEHSFTPNDVDVKVKAAAKTILRAMRGKGAIKEVAEHILEING